MGRFHAMVFVDPIAQITDGKGAITGIGVP